MLKRSLSKLKRSSKMLFLSGISLSLLACCPPVTKPVPLPIEPQPQLMQVVSDDDGGLDEQNTKNAISNIYLYKGSLDNCNLTIKLFNATIK